MKAEPAISRYAVKQQLKRARHDVGSKHRIKADQLAKMFEKWIDEQKRQVGRGHPQTRDEEMRTELVWLRSLDAKLSRMSEWEAVVRKKQWTKQEAAE